MKVQNDEEEPFSVSEDGSVESGKEEEKVEQLQSERPTFQLTQDSNKMNSLTIGVNRNEEQTARNLQKQAVNTNAEIDKNSDSSESLLQVPREEDSLSNQSDMEIDGAGRNFLEVTSSRHESNEELSDEHSLY